MPVARLARAKSRRQFKVSGKTHMRLDTCDIMKVGPGTGHPRMRRMTLILFVITLLFLMTDEVDAQCKYAPQVGAWGDNASRGNMGAQVEIRTHIYDSGSSVFDYFWVGNNLDNGAFIQFGYGLEQGYYCLRGQTVGGRFTCLGASEHIGAHDARWQWQYWPKLDGNDFYYGIGPANSAGMEGTWHKYSIVPNAENSWTFVLDDRPVDSVSFECTHSKDPVYEVAEKVASTEQFGSLGPAEFRNLAYLKQDGWHAVNYLYVLRSCAINTNCSFDIPYGVSLKGPNYIVAGSGLEKLKDGTLLWTNTVTLTVLVSPIIHVLVDGVDRGSGSVQLTLTKGLHTVSLSSTVEPMSGLLGTLGGKWVFDAWYEEGGLVTRSTSWSIALNSSRCLEARWQADYTAPIVLVAGIVIVAVSARRHQKRSTRT